MREGGRANKREKKSKNCVLPTRLPTWLQDMEKERVRETVSQNVFGAFAGVLV